MTEITQGSGEGVKSLYEAPIEFTDVGNISNEEFAKAKKALVKADLPKRYNLWVFKEKDGSKHEAYFTDEEISERKRANPDILWIN